ncbi:2-oxoacid:acceptor oxidoreductase subunit alpha [Alkalibaculum sp. M08DMB]|uniref:2-oxoacid:acceptor oxidoreductase subunit alpha n=1 Tax=Alkalibaculum sporogenes TaxID=2655001 RepID=A0A6A7K8R1_9FIRM|nr:2-oxoacid:acceptor oxidoreductase subunit alpha [Alkalibaculum sporogenes]MPW25889.1 2-oxoacid:acceptor oxidoreductase subunit alpha [Alkalibaculum sporogenes]
MRESLTIVISGEAGQGLQTCEDLIMNSSSKQYYVYSCSDVMSRVRGGNNTVEIRVSNFHVYAYKNKIDILFLLNDHSFDRLKNRIGDNTIVFGEESFASRSFIENKNGKFIELNLEYLAKKAGSKLFTNTILYGFTAGLLDLDSDKCHRQIEDRFKKLNDNIISDNKKAFDIGYQDLKKNNIQIKVTKSEEAKNYKVLHGNTAVGIGALAGGCNFISAYPMSPGTGLLEYLAEKSQDFEVIVEQAEDEIAALNMVIGAWYGGARAITTTSGGGFSLMHEAVSLSAMTETPCVIHLAQRPGPATGLPTRTEQADLTNAVYAGHGEFSRIVLAPGKLEDGVLLTQKAFYFADKYQVPVIILTDQHFLESIGQMKKFTLNEKYLKSYIVKTNKDYKRYELNESGISDRGIPGYGEGFVKVDSDEHDENGSITEDFDMRVKMNKKRLARKQLILSDYVDADLIGPKTYKHLIVGWGSTYGVLKEFIEGREKQDTAFLYVKQVFPLDKRLLDYFSSNKTIIVIENNSTGQFANLLQQELGINIQHRVNKYSGEPFSIEEIERSLEEVLNEKI